MSRQNNYVAPKKGSLCDIYLTAESFNLYFSFYHGIYYWRVGVQTSIITKIIYKKKSTLTVLGPNTFNYKWVRSANNKTTDLKTSTTQKQQTSTYKIAEFINPPHTHTHTSYSRNEGKNQPLPNYVQLGYGRHLTSELEMLKNWLSWNRQSLL